MGYALLLLHRAQKFLILPRALHWTGDSQTAAPSSSDPLRDHVAEDSLRWYGVEHDVFVGIVYERASHANDASDRKVTRVHNAAERPGGRLAAAAGDGWCAS
jgi:hypothetical protein